MSKAAFSGLFLPLHLLLLQYSIRICRSSKLCWFSKYISCWCWSTADRWVWNSNLPSTSPKKPSSRSVVHIEKLGNTTNESWTVRTDLSLQENGAANYQQYSNCLLRNNPSRLTRAMERTPNISVLTTLNLQIRYVYVSPPTHKQQQKKQAGTFRPNETTSLGARRANLRRSRGFYRNRSISCLLCYFCVR